MQHAQLSRRIEMIIGERILFTIHQPRAIRTEAVSSTSGIQLYPNLLDTDRIEFAIDKVFYASTCSTSDIKDGR